MTESRISTKQMQVCAIRMARNFLFAFILLYRTIHVDRIML